jgi:hypothetical protein
MKRFLLSLVAGSLGGTAVACYALSSASAESKKVPLKQRTSRGPDGGSPLISVSGGASEI